MQIHTSRFGEVQYKKEDIIYFAEGIPGLEEYKQYIFVPVDDREESPFIFLQSIEEGELCFFLLDTLNFFPEYEIELDGQTIEILEIDQPEDVLVLTMITVQDELEKATTNLKAPIIMNMKKKLAKQLVQETERYLIKQPLFDTTQENQQKTKANKG